MKRHIQKTGVRRFFGQDLVELQAEPLAVLDGFFTEYGPCVIEGCAITAANGGTFDVSPGLVALECTDPDSGAVTVRTMPFAGAQGVALPLYLAANWKVVERVYDDGKVKPIGYHLTAIASGVVPEAPHLVLTATGGNRFVDALQDGTHRFITDTERSKWNDILRQAKEYAGLQAEAAKRTAMAHTDTTAAALRDEQAIADAVGLRSAKEYADRVVAALVDGSPEALNTLQELAAALGGDPNFATTVLTQIGGKITAHIEVRSKAELDDLTRTLTAGIFEIQTNETPFGEVGAVVQRAHTWGGGNWETVQLFMGITTGIIKFRRVINDIQQSIVELYHSGNLNPASPTSAGLLSAGDKAKLDGLSNYTHPNDGNTRHVTDQNITNWNNKVDGWVKIYNRGEFDQSTRLTQSGVAFLQTTDTPFGEFGAVIQRQNSWGGGWECVQLFMSITTPKVMVRRVGHQGDMSLVELHHSGNLKIIRGSVDIDGNLVPGSNGGTCYRSGGVVRLFHNLGHTNFSATASVYSSNPTLYDNVVSVVTKTSSYLEFVVTEGPGNGIEWAPFDFIIIPW